MKSLLSIPIILLLAGLLQTLCAQNIIIGQTALISFTKIPLEATVRFNKKQIPLLKHPLAADKRFVLIPVPYRSSPGEKKITITYPGGKKSLDLLVKKGGYRSESIQVAPSKVKPNKKQSKRTASEYREAMKIYRTMTPQRYWNKPFIRPMSSHITSPFGTARLYNGSLKSFHSGTDFKAMTGTPIHAVNDGVVVLAKDRYYAGNSVIIDHGEGLYTCYYHLSKISVSRGDKVKQNDLLGLSGATGRVTGPHLHFAVMLYGVQVDPLQLLDQINSLFVKPDDQE